MAIVADDPNDDRLRYRINYRRRGDEAWRILVVGLYETRASWDTSGMVDDVYELLVEADDSPDNSGADTLRGRRISQPFLVDNTPPAVSGLAFARDGAIRFRAEDQRGLIRRAAVGRSGRATLEVRPVDGLADSRTEDYLVDIPAYAGDVGPVVVMIEDDSGNWGVAELAAVPR